MGGTGKNLLALRSLCEDQKWIKSSLVFAALQADALGNFFRMYGRQFGPVMYDEFAHLAVQALTMPLIVWLLAETLKRFGHSLPLGLIIFFAVTIFFSLSACYEIIELWDELHFGGQRIWHKHDAPNDLQWNLVDIVFGALLGYVLLKRKAQPFATAQI